jgi:hypothetical protein
MNFLSGFTGGGGSHVQQLVAGTGITLSPSSGFGIVTINSADGANVMLVDGGLCSTYRCGVDNSACGSYAFSGGGQCNLANGNYSFVGGGLCNCATACGAVLGGFGNNANAPYSGAFGCNINACNACTFYSNNLCACGNTSSITSNVTCLTSGQAVCSGVNGILTNYNAPSIKSYGSFYDINTQSGIAGSVLTMGLSNSDPWNSGVSVTSGNRITLANAGVYNLQFSAQMVKTSGNSASHAHIWLSQNGITTPYSASQIGFPSNSVYVVAAWNFFFQTTNPNEYVQLLWEINSNVNNGISLQYQPATGNIPEIPSLIVTVNQL